ncbi:hypothetical protein OESDEN_11948 [Oesophagostomum dentatum]|uniref:PAS fold-3 domain-containing protein n=1 Tax=Oesophagostomum dentatum TaxID=61180 RepID=A0A0B1SXM0_OESDE|nr:hypothetical protein OESDEN_11948 [Oesophagostomum dentatum]
MHASSEPAGQGSVNAHATALTKYADTPTGSFMTRHTSDMRISYVHDRLNYILRNELKTLMGASFFELIDPNDLMSFRESMKTLFAKGHVRTPLYRLLAANNAVVWVTTEASTVNHTSKGQRAQYVICVHHIAGIKSAMEEAAEMSEGISAGIAVHIKKEVDDTRDYTGRQPHVDATGDFQMQPFTGREDFSVMTRLLSFGDPETTKPSTIERTSERSETGRVVTNFGMSDNDDADDEHQCCCRSRDPLNYRKRTAYPGLSPVASKRQRTNSDEWIASEFESEDADYDEVPENANFLMVTGKQSAFSAARLFGI